jgi:hypothetical protein
MRGLSRLRVQTRGHFGGLRPAGGAPFAPGTVAGPSMVRTDLPPPVECADNDAAQGRGDRKLPRSSRGGATSRQARTTRVAPTALYVTSSDPRSPSRGSEERARQVVHWLKISGYHVRVVFFSRVDVTPESALTKVTEDFYIFQSSTGPTAADYWCPSDLTKAVTQLVRETQPSLVMVRYSYLAPCLGGVERRPGRTLAVEADNIFADRKSRFAAKHVPYDFFSWSYTSEAAALSTVDLVVCISNEEESIIRALVEPRVRVLTLEFMVEAERVQTTDFSNLLFVGSAFPANAAGLRWFLHQVWPSVSSHPCRPGLKVIGKVGETFGKSDQLEFVGYAEDIEAWYRTCALVINPSVVNSGVSTKSAAAIYRGKCGSSRTRVRALSPGGLVVVIHDEVL